ncbi:cell envelope integrity protein TolA [Paraburkholderia sp. RL17-383-BIF-A]|jgi:colicin import membrane protein|uniref:cell envelope integrity protein TolA n=1 Tax=Burkholderiaceae TaxID=119060 RepID=UPI00089BAD54|nr:cell envelope integrity protein TolA [Burkholderia sp. WP9]SED15061.1 Cell division and transport-associated protein TolA [Burkholderia sp. WP9]
MIRKNSEYPLQPPRERGTGRAFAFALVMHALLGFFLYHGIQWQNSTPEGAEAELWTEVPDAVIPRPVPPPPAPVPVAPAPPVRDEQADIALQEKKRQQQEAARQAQLAEQQRQQKLQAQQEAEAKRQQQLAAEQAAQLAAQKAAAAKQKQQQQQQQQQEANKLKQQQLAEQQKQQQLKEQQQEQQKQAEAEAQKKADAQKAAKAKAQADAAAQAKKLDAERRARLAQMQGLATGGTGSTTSDGLGKNGTGSGSGGTATSPGYSDKVRRAVRPNITWGGETSGLETVVSVRCSPTGTLLGATISRSSGNAAWDDAALRAVQRTDPMPQDINGKTPTSFLITLRPAG